MVVEMFNWLYFLCIFLVIGAGVGLYFLLRKRSDKTKKWVIFGILMFNLLLHFSKFFIEPYASDPELLAEDLWFINICAVSVLTFPFIFLSKSDSAKDFMFYLGVLSGFLAVVLPTEALNNVYALDVVRFYICHGIFIIVPLLMVILKVHKLNYRRIWRMPFYMMGVFLVILCNNVLSSELGFTELRDNDMLDPNYPNPSFLWGPGSDALASFFTWLTPEFMTTVPYGDYAGQAKYWPFFWMIPSCIFYFILFPIVMCLPWEWKHIRDDFKGIKLRMSHRRAVRVARKLGNAVPLAPKESIATTKEIKVEKK